MSMRRDISSKTTGCTLFSGAASFVTAAAKQLSETERWCCLYPGLRKLLLTDISVIEELDVLSALPAPVSSMLVHATDLLLTLPRAAVSASVRSRCFLGKPLAWKLNVADRCHSERRSAIEGHRGIDAAADSCQ